ncbi:regulator of telomere elongation helicase 1-like [Glandiceps talaboti]
MPLLKIRGVDVEFPFNPYKCQEDYMARVIQGLQEKKNGILESPTGTGKTLCLLCATLAWRQAYVADQQLQSLRRNDPNDMFSDGYGKELSEELYGASGGWGGPQEGMLMDKPRIIYASRTHSQLSQAVQQLKDTSYRPKVSIIGSREQLCIHPEVSSQQNNNTMVHMCRAKVGARTCHFYNKVDEKRNEKDFTENILDIEDLVKLGQKHKTCPYYMARELKTTADIIFMPYNYLLDPKSRKTHGVELRGNILVFDEAHNVEKMCEESVSFDFTSYDMASCVNETSKLLEKNVEVEKLNQQFNTDSSACDFDSGELYQLKALFLVLEEAIDEIPLSPDGSGLTKPGSFIYELLSRAKITFDTYTQALDLLEKIVSFLTNSPTGVFSKTNGLQKFSDILKIVFSNDSGQSSNQLIAMMSKYYKVHIHSEDFKKKQQRTDLWTSNPKSDKKSGKTLSCWCFSPGFSMRDLAAQDVRSIILTSGTLSPLESFTSEMQIKFPIKLENPHVIERHQMLVSIVTKGPDGTALNSSYENRSSVDYMQSLGNAIVNYSRIVPNGLLVFFPSYPVMNKCMEVWQESGICNRISQYKPMFTEPRNKTQFQDAMEDFYQKINDPTLNGAAFFAVCRGKVSEGLDFADNNGRAVIITGLPFPPRMDPKVNLKMKFLDEVKSKPPNGITGRQWYRQQASRAVNQAIGRVIRHKEDYGAIILCDNRFTYSDARAQLPSWVRPYVKTYDNFGLLMRDLMNFFKTAEKIMPNPQLKPKSGQSSNEQRQMTSLPPQTTGATTFGASTSYSTSKLRTEAHQASLVVSHVPSLRRSEKSVTESRLKIMYETTAPSTSKSKATGLLDALDQHEKKTTEDDNDDCDGNDSGEGSKYQAALKKRMEEQRKKATLKKKIVIRNPSSQFKDKEFEKEFLKPARPTVTIHSRSSKQNRMSGGRSEEPKQIVEEGPKTSTTTDTTTGRVRNKQVLLSANEYIIKVRKSLSDSAYQTFNKVMAKYKKTNEFAPLVAGLADIFIEDPRNHDLFKSSYRYVRPFHKKEFDQVCQNLIGVGCGYKPEDSVPRKTLEKAKLQCTTVTEVHAEKRKRENESGQFGRPMKIPLLADSKSTASLGGPESKNKHLDSTTHLNRGKPFQQHGNDSNEDIFAKTFKRAKQTEKSKIQSRKNGVENDGKTVTTVISETKLQGLHGNQEKAGIKGKGQAVRVENQTISTADCVTSTPAQSCATDTRKEIGISNKRMKEFTDQDLSQASPMSIDTSQEFGADNLNASVSLFSDESSALDTSMDSVSDVQENINKQCKDEELVEETRKEMCRSKKMYEGDNNINIPELRENQEKFSKTSSKKFSKKSSRKEDESETENTDHIMSAGSSADGSDVIKVAYLNEKEKNVGEESGMWDSFSQKSIDMIKDDHLFENHVKKFRTKSGLVCKICNKESIQPFKARCQHICCKNCWSAYIEEHKKCPQCGQKTKLRHLKRVYFPRGHSQQES